MRVVRRVQLSLGTDSRQVGYVHGLGSILVGSGTLFIHARAEGRGMGASKVSKPRLESKAGNCTGQATLEPSTTLVFAYGETDLHPPMRRRLPLPPYSLQAIEGTLIGNYNRRSGPQLW